MQAGNTQFAPYKCECGETYSSRFCPNCGKERKEQETFTCECGYSGPKSNFCPNCGKTIRAQAPSSVITPEPVILFSISTYTSTNPPVSTSLIIYEYSDTELLMDNNGTRKLISADVIEPAMEIIRKNRLDDPDFTDPSAMGIMGGSVSVTFRKDGKYIQTSLQKQGFAVTNAEGQLRGLFLNA